MKHVCVGVVSHGVGEVPGYETVVWIENVPPAATVTIGPPTHVAGPVSCVHWSICNWPGEKFVPSTATVVAAVSERLVFGVTVRISVPVLASAPLVQIPNTAMATEASANLL